MFSMHGYIIQPDGTVYTLLHRWHHGLVLAFLYPEVLKNFKREPKNLFYDEQGEPIEDSVQRDTLNIPKYVELVNVYDFQDFELSEYKNTQAIRICPGRIMGPTSVDLPPVPCTPKQCEALKNVTRGALSMHMGSEVSMDHRDTTLADLLKQAPLTEEERDKIRYANYKSESESESDDESDFDD